MSKKTGSINAKIKTSHLIGGVVLCFFGLAAWTKSLRPPEPPLPKGTYGATCTAAFCSPTYFEWSSTYGVYYMWAHCPAADYTFDNPDCKWSYLYFGPNNEPPCAGQDIANCNGILTCGPCPGPSKKKRDVRKTGPVKKHPVKKPPEAD